MVDERIPVTNVSLDRYLTTVSDPLEKKGLSRPNVQSENLVEIIALKESFDPRFENLYKDFLRSFCPRAKVIVNFEYEPDYQLSSESDYGRLVLRGTAYWY